MLYIFLVTCNFTFSIGMIEVVPGKLFSYLMDIIAVFVVNCLNLRNSFNKAICIKRKVTGCNILIKLIKNKVNCSRNRLYAFILEVSFGIILIYLYI